MINTIKKEKVMPIAEYCGACGALNTATTDEYKLRSCIECGELVLIPNYEECVSISSVEKVNHVNELPDNVYEFILFFEYWNSEEIDEFIINQDMSCHAIFCRIASTNDTFNLDEAKIRVKWHSVHSYDYDFTPSQIATIKNNVSEYIVNENIGTLAVTKSRQLLEEVCENYGCSLEVGEDNSVILEDFVEAELDSIEDALVYFYNDFLKEDWAKVEDLEFIEKILQDKALRVVLEWLYDYEYKVLEMKQDANCLDMIVEDLQSLSEEDTIITRNLDEWCKWFIEEISAKDADEDVCERWEKEDIKPMQDYLDRRECSKSKNRAEVLSEIKPDINEKFLGESYRTPQDYSVDKVINERNSEEFIADSNELSAIFGVEYANRLHLDIISDTYSITTKLPITLSVIDINAGAVKYEVVNRFLFEKIDSEYKLKTVLSTDCNTVEPELITDFVGISMNRFYMECYKLCDTYKESCVRISSESYEINSVSDLINLSISADVLIGDLEYEFHCSQKDVLYDVMKNCSGLKLKETQSIVKHILSSSDNDLVLLSEILVYISNMRCDEFKLEEMIIGKKAMDVARAYARKMLNITEDSSISNSVSGYINYMDYLRDNASYNEINGYIVVFV